MCGAMVKFRVRILNRKASKCHAQKRLSTFPHCMYIKHPKIKIGR